MTIYFTSDTHFGHSRVREYCLRKHETVEEMNEHIIELWNNTVGSTDTIYHLGDFSMAKRVAFEIAPRLNGYKILCVGNHEHDMFGFWREDKKQAKRMRIRDLYLENGFDEIYQWVSLGLTGSNGDTYALALHHFPPRMCGQEKLDDRYWEDRLDWTPDLWYLGGHLHGRYKKWENCIDVGYDVEQKIYSEYDIIETIKDTRRFIPSNLTNWYKTDYYQQGVSKKY